jgi:hypothetical protein
MHARAMYLRCLDNLPYAHPGLASGDYSRLSCDVGIRSSGLASVPPELIPAALL